VAIGVGPVTAHGAGCNSVMLVDANSGAQRWMASDPNPFALNFIHAEIVGGTVVADITGQLIGLSVANGQQVWDLRDPPLTSDRYALCTAQDFMVGPSATFVLFNCVGAAGKQAFLTQIDAAAGKVTSKVEVPGGTAIGTGLVSVDPVVVAIPGAGGTDGKYVVMDPSGHAQVIPQSGSYGTLDVQDFSLMPASRLHRQYPLVVTGGTLVTRTVPRTVSSARTSNQLVAFDIGTGKELWSKQLVATSNSVPFGIAGKGVVAIVTGTYESPPRVYQLALSTGDAKALGPAYPRALINAPEGSLLYWKDGRVYGVHLYATGPGFLLYALK
jgi:outer membrane protein assembly factor BamB